MARECGHHGTRIRRSAASAAAVSLRRPGTRRRLGPSRVGALGQAQPSPSCRTRGAWSARGGRASLARCSWCSGGAGRGARKRAESGDSVPATFPIRSRAWRHACRPPAWVVLRTGTCNLGRPPRLAHGFVRSRWAGHCGVVRDARRDGWAILCRRPRARGLDHQPAGTRDNVVGNRAGGSRRGRQGFSAHLGVWTGWGMPVVS